MSTHTQAKHTDPAAEKPDRRRGAAGRAAALRRAPSDSDCSGETASLSADSGERRPPPPPPRGKTRNRRRGSEWEVLEGLKDGQRFERRPEVFNGFLHKKRKWPLKGWHKRFFVVDGGILVYARSPTDVARGRLHGSLDVGLSVISAKPRRRRIDIDADEFIYHLRAKTPDVFRTWLNVLKAHRLYRQHLLTFGARESVPKIHAPLDDLPPTDTSSRTSQSSLESFSSITQSQSDPNNPMLSQLTSSINEHKSQSNLSRWKTNESFAPFESSEFSNSKTSDMKPKCGSLCSTHCIGMRREIHDSYQTLPGIPLSIDETQMHSTDLDLNTLNSYYMASTSESKSNFEDISNEGSKKDTFEIGNEKIQQIYMLNNVTHMADKNKYSPLWDDDKHAALFCFPRKRRDRTRTEEEWAMKRSKKSTNLVKYRNIGNEPALTKPLLRQMILCKYKRCFANRNVDAKSVNCNLIINERTDKSTQDVVTASEHDHICEQLIFNLFDTFDNDTNSNGEVGARSSCCVNRVVRELYDLKLNESKKHPIKTLFKSLLHFFLKNTDGKFKDYIKRDIAVMASNTHFTRDKEVSIVISPNESRVEDFEKVVNNTVYGCSVVKCTSRETDIAITKTLIDNLDSLSSQFSHNLMEDVDAKRTESSELPLLQEYFKHILNELSLPKAVAKDFLNAYLDVLDHRSKSPTSTESSDISRESNVDRDPICHIQTECVQKKISKSVSASKNDPSVGDTVDNATDETPKNLKDILDRMIGLFTSSKVDEKPPKDKVTNHNIDKTDPVRSELKSEELNSKAFKSVDVNDKKIVIDLSKYDIDNISLSNNASALGSKYITINLKEKLQNSNELKIKNSCNIFDTDSSAGTSNKMKSDFNNINVDYQTYIKSKNIFNGDNTRNFQVPNDKEDLQTNGSSSGATSKAFISDHSFDVPNNSSKFSKEMLYPHRKANTQCFFLSSIKEDVPIVQEKMRKLEEPHLAPDRLQQQPCKTEPGLINEDFIIRILEHLTILSKDIPGINREIKHLYLKLTAYDKAKANPGLGLLGKIYAKETSQKALNNDHSLLACQLRHIHKKAIEIAVNTSIVFPKLKNVEDRALSAIVFAEALANIAVQTLSIDDEVKESHLDIKDEWFKKLTQEYVKNNAIKCMLRKYNHLPQSIRIAHPIRAKIPEKPVTKKSSILLKDLSISSPPLSLSSRLQKDPSTKIEQLYKRTVSKLVRSESLTESSVYINNDMNDELKTLYRCTSENSYCSGLISPNAVPIRGPQAGFVSGTPGGRLASWIVESGGPLESASRELGQAQLSVQQLQRLLDAILELQNIHHHDTDVSLEGASPNVKKDRRKFGLRKKKSNSKCASVELAPPHVDASSSHMALSALTAPPSPGGGASSMPNSAASLPIVNTKIPTILILNPVH